MIEIKEVEKYGDNQYRCKAKLVILNQNGTVYNKKNLIKNIILVSETEGIRVGDKYLEHTGVKPDRYEVFTRTVDDESIENSWKVLATDENLLPVVTETINRGNWKHGETIYLDCKSEIKCKFDFTSDFRCTKSDCGCEITNSINFNGRFVTILGRRRDDFTKFVEQKALSILESNNTFSQLEKIKTQLDSIEVDKLTPDCLKLFNNLKISIRKASEQAEILQTYL